MNIHIGTTKAWTEADVELLTQLWGEGFSASEIAARMGGRTRNSIIGKIDRMGLPTRANRVQPSRPRGPRPVYERKTTTKRKFRVIHNDAPIIAKSRLWDPLDSTNPVTLIDRKRKQCVWPLDLPHEVGMSLVCGEPIWGECVYCKSHSKVAYRPARERA